MASGLRACAGERSERAAHRDGLCAAHRGGNPRLPGRRRARLAGGDSAGRPYVRASRGRRNVERERAAARRPGTRPARPRSSPSLPFCGTDVRRRASGRPGLRQRVVRDTEPGRGGSRARSARAQPEPPDRVPGEQPARNPRVRRLVADGSERCGAGRPERRRLPGGGPPRPHERGGEVQPGAVAAPARRPRRPARAGLERRGHTRPPRRRGRGAGERLLIAASLTFLTPGGALLALAAALPLAALALASQREQRARAVLGLSAPAGARRWRRAAAVLATVALLGLAASQPALRSSSSIQVRTDAQALFVIDVSRSMLASRAPGAATRFARAR